MSTKLHTFIDIFEAKIDNGDTLVRLSKIEIPMIQRDYAQGRLDSDVTGIRKRFLDTLYNAVVKEPVTLDFIYGDINEKGTMTPLDGQQRLTTLFLLHWYAAKKENIPKEKYSFLNKFSYETRYSSRYFCGKLVEFSPTFETELSADIMNQEWFPYDWKNDPTINSMLVMLDAIDNRFRDVPDIWSRLENNAVTFSFLPIKDMGLTDELYIKMNSRGKPLTLFEHFKAELERQIRLLDKNTADSITESIDGKWTDLLWRYRNGKMGSADDNVIDDEFLRYFKFICDIICYRNGESPQSRSSDIFDLLQIYFSAENKSTQANITALEDFFNCWCDIDGYDNPTSFLESFMSNKHEPGKILIDSRYKINIFEDCLHTYSDKTGRIRQFPLNRIVLLYAVTVYLQNQNTVSEKDFKRRIRIINNLIQNSEDEISDRLDRNGIPAILKAVDTIILTGNIDISAKSFNEHQIKEEAEKAAFLAVKPSQAETMFELEDHELLYGQIGIVGLENISYASRFASLFDCSWDKVDCALMTVGNYGQQERNKWRHQYGSKKMQSAWSGLFHKSANTGFDNTKKVLIQLLAENENFNNKILDNIVSEFIEKCEKENEYPWAYYYVKYPAFRPGSYGKLSNTDTAGKPYMFSVMQTKTQWSLNTYMPYLKEADSAHLSKDSMGQRLTYTNVYITCENSAYIIHNNSDECEVDRIDIAQNTNGIDIEDRIVKLKNYLALLN